MAPGAPGSKPYWTVAAKTGVGTAIGAESLIWFSLAEGIVTEVFYPSVDLVAIRDLGLIVTGPDGFFSDERHDTMSEVNYLADGVPAFRLENGCRRGRYEIEKTILADPRRSVLLQQVRFRPRTGALDDYALYALLEPHLGNQGQGNTAWIGQFKGLPMLFARREGWALALACSAPWRKRSAGFVGESDGRTLLSRHAALEPTYERAENGNVALAGEVDLAACQGQFILALAFGRDELDAAHRARASLLQGFESAQKEYLHAWKQWQKDLLPQRGAKAHAQNLYKISAAVMQSHESKNFPGGIVASLAIPWGFSHGDGDSGYHLVWPRDMIQTVGGLLAVRGHENARRVLFYLHVTQEDDGHWSQNMHVNGLPSWDGIQLDETAFVILLVDLARREGALQESHVDTLWHMVRKAAGYLVCHGPVTPLDRWEEQSGYFASTLAVEIPALLAAAEMAEARSEADVARYLRETADAWHAEIDSLLYVTDNDLARDAGVEGYYARFAAADQRTADRPAVGTVTLKNHPPGKGVRPLDQIVSPDALALVRFGLRAADDPRIVGTAKVIDHLLKVETPTGPGWHRYNADGYGEHADGAPFEGTGIGRLWPLLTGERAHFELAAGRRKAAEELLRTMESFANASGLFSEQVWDSPDIAERDLYFGRPSGSAMPLVWAHAEYVKLRRSLKEGRVFDMPRLAKERYVGRSTGSDHKFWRFEQPCRSIAEGQILRIEVHAPARIHWSTSNWDSCADLPTVDTGLGLHYADLPVQDADAGETIAFTFHWPEAGRWEGRNFEVRVIERSAELPTVQHLARQRAGNRRPRRIPTTADHNGSAGRAD
jgi:glucoamylase